MSRKSTAAIPISFLITLLHAGCCLLPLILAGISSSVHFYTLGHYKPLLTFIQLILIIYLLVQIVRFYRPNSGTPSKTELWSYLTGFVIAVAELTFGILEPLRTVDQKLAQQRFEYFKRHGQVVLKSEGHFNNSHILGDLQRIKGVMPSSVRFDGKSIVASYQKDKTSKVVILLALKTKGYKVEFAD